MTLIYFKKKTDAITCEEQIFIDFHDRTRAFSHALPFSTTPVSGMAHQVGNRNEGSYQHQYYAMQSHVGLNGVDTRYPS